MFIPQPRPKAPAPLKAAGGLRVQGTTTRRVIALSWPWRQTR